MRRRDFITMLGSAGIVWPHRTAGAQANQTVIAFFVGGRQALSAGVVNAFGTGLKELGYEDGRNVRMVHRFAEGRPDQLPVIA